MHSAWTAGARTLEHMDLHQLLLTLPAVVAMVLVGLLATVPTLLELGDGMDATR